MEITKIFAILINPHIQVKFFCAILFNIFWVWDMVGCEDCQMSLFLYEMVVFNLSKPSSQKRVTIMTR